MPVLWRKFSEDTNLPAVLTGDQRAVLEQMFDSANPESAWRCAVRDLGLGAEKLPQRLMLWHADTPYINWSAIAGLVSAGVIDVQRGAEGEIFYAPSYKITRLWSLVKTQWTVSRYIGPRLGPAYPLPESPQAQLRESLALGLATLALMLRLPKHDEAQLAAWLALPGEAPSPVQATVRQIEALQKRRTLLSPAWTDLFPDHGGTALQDAPEYFWDVPPTASAKVEALQVAPAAVWKGLPVCPGVRAGRAILLTGRKTDAQFVAAAADEPLILVFPRARPDAVEFYAHAAAVLFAEGGALAHACVVAREYNLPCVTALGLSFKNDMQTLAAHGPVYLHIDGATGQVKLDSRA